MVVREHRGGGSDFSPHVADGGHSWEKRSGKHSTDAQVTLDSYIFVKQPWEGEVSHAKTLLHRLNNSFFACGVFPHIFNTDVIQLCSKVENAVYTECIHICSQILLQTRPAGYTFPMLKQSIFPTPTHQRLCFQSCGVVLLALGDHPDIQVCISQYQSSAGQQLISTYCRHLTLLTNLQRLKSATLALPNAVGSKAKTTSPLRKAVKFLISVNLLTSLYVYFSLFRMKQL